MQRLSIHDTCITLNFPWQIKVGAHASICERRVLRTIKRTESRIRQCLSWTVLSVWIWWRKIFLFFFNFNHKRKLHSLFFYDLQLVIVSLCHFVKSFRFSMFTTEKVRQQHLQTHGYFQNRSAKGKLLQWSTKNQQSKKDN